jgi:hypothetical protein
MGRRGLPWARVSESNVFALVVREAPLVPTSALTTGTPELAMAVSTPPAPRFPAPTTATPTTPESFPPHAPADENTSLSPGDLAIITVHGL